MGIQYHCTNNNCNYPGDTQFEMTFKSEYIMDNNNLATTFCPFCKAEMEPSISMDFPNNTNVEKTTNPLL